MKIKTLTLVAFGFLTTIIIYSCNNTTGVVSNTNETICSNYTDISTLEVALIHAMTKKYKENQLSIINQSSKEENHYFSEPELPEEPYGDARAIWFDLETLKAFVYQIEMKAKTQGEIPVSSTDLGIRIYYASYPDANYGRYGYSDLLSEDGSNILPENYQKRHTLVMIPTIRRDGQNVDFDPLNATTFTKPLSSNPAKYSPGSSTQMLALTGISKSTSTKTEAKNHGGLRPPPPLDDDGNF